MSPHHMRRLLVSIIGLTVLGLTSGATASSYFRYFDVTITNITANQVFTRLLVASHTAGIRLFTPGEPASEALEILAESGNTAPLETLLGESPRVLDVQIARDDDDQPSVLPPGKSITVRVRARGRFRYVSVAAMLVPTNDALVALNGVRGPGYGSISVNALAYDAGTEANDELCASIPGPPNVCVGGEGFNQSREDAEGFVHVHRGIHGIGDIAAATYDWRNPVARITIRRR